MSTYWEQQRERSTRFGTALMVRASLFFGRFIIRIVLWFIVAYFYSTSPAAVRASRHALTRLLGRAPTGKDIFKQFYYFGTCAVDRLYLLRNRRNYFKVSVSRPPEVAALSTSGQGCLMVVAHFGSFEVFRRIGTHERQLPLSILMDRKQGEMLVKHLERLSPGFALQIIDAAQRGPDLVLALRDALRAGRMVCIMADRARADERVLDVNFFRSPARFPEGPWALASALKVPVILGFGTFLGGRRYHVEFELFTQSVTTDRNMRNEDLQKWAQRYADRLEFHVRNSPYNWFNFYDYWLDDMPATTSTATQAEHP